MKHLIKDLEWFRGDNCIRVAYSPSHEYKLLADDNKYKVAYFELEAKNKEPVKFATGFTTLEQAKEWAFNHHCEKMTPWLNHDPLTETVNWFKEAKPEPTNADVIAQVACHLEEVDEFIDSMDIHPFTEHLEEVRRNCKKIRDKGYSDKSIENSDHLELLDALADQIVTAVGVAYMMGFDIIGALTEVNASNWSKFVDGKAVTDDNGKIIKGGGYFKPQLEKYLGGSND